MWTLAVAVVAVVVAVAVVVVAVVELPHGLAAVVICKTEGILVIVPNPLEIFLEDRGNGKPVNKPVKGNARKDRVNGKPVNKPVKGNARKDRVNGKPVNKTGRGNAAKEPISVKGNAAKDRVNGSSRLVIANRTVRTLLTIIATVTGVVAVGTVAVIMSPRVGVGWG
jgi:4-amino-4-deoxy-L-arabinose transferase-like glycosyltransferase